MNISKRVLTRGAASLAFSALVLSCATPLHSALAQVAKSAASGPKVTGSKFVMPQTTLPRPVTQKQKMAMALKVTSAAKTHKIVSLPARPGLPKGKTRGNTEAPLNFPAGYTGLTSIYQFTNDDFPNRNIACGPAAVATIVNKYGSYSSTPPLPSQIWYKYPPDVALGIMGTSNDRLVQAINGYGIPGNWYSGEAGLKNALSLKKPCIVMLDVGAISEEGWKVWGGHWTVAYAYDNTNIYLTNWNPDSHGTWDGGKCTWAAFRKAWNTWLTQTNGRPNQFYCPNG